MANMQELSAKSRKELGKQVGALRRAGFLPAVVYGEEIKSQPIAVSVRDFEKAYRGAGESTVIALALDGGKSLNVMIHDVAYDPLSGKPIHADFYSVRMDKKIDARIPIVFAGESPAVKNEGGILVKVLHEIEIRALPQDLPHEFVVELSRLSAIGDRVYARDVPFSPGIEMRIDADEVVALIEAPRVEEAEVAAPIEAAEVKTEREAKAEEKAKKEESVAAEEE